MATQSKDEEMAKFLDDLSTNRDVEETAEIYSNWAANYDEFFKSYGNLTPVVVEEAVKAVQLHTDVRILDIGAGTGSMGKKLRSLGYKNIDCLDGCGDMLEMAKKESVYDNYYVAFVRREEKLPFPDETYDAVVMCCAIYPGHIEAEAVGRIARVIRKGGHLIIINASSIHSDGSCNFAGHAPLLLLTDAGLFEDAPGYPKVYDKTVSQHDVYVAYVMKKLL